MKNSKFLLTSLLAAATMSATAFGANATWSGTAENTDWSGANWTKDSSGQTIDSADKAVFTSDTAGRTVTATGEVSADKLFVGIGGNITFSGGTFKFTNTTDGIPADEDTTTASQNWGTVKIASGATLDFAGNFAAARWSRSSNGTKTVEVWENAVLSVSGTMSADTGLALTNNGIIKVGNLQYKTGAGWNTNTFTGTGTIIAGTLTIGNIAQLKIENQKLILGSGGITTDTGGWGFALGAMTLGASETWSTSRDITFNAASGKKTIIDTSAYDTTNYTTSATEGKTITLGGTLSVNGAVEKIGAGTLELAGTVNVGEGGSITVSAGTLTSRGTFNLTSAGTLNGTISATGGTLNLAGKLNLTSAINVTDGVSVTVSNSVAFVLSDAVKSGSEWILISGASSIDGWDTGTLSIGNFRKEDGTHFMGRGGSISIGGLGKVSVTEGQAANLVWSGDQGSNWDTTTQNWTNEGQADRFYVADNVKFDKNASVAVAAGGVTAGKVTIASEKAVTLSGGNVAADFGFELQSGARLSLGAGNANGATATLVDNSVYAIDASAASSEISLANVTGGVDSTIEINAYTSPAFTTISGMSSRFSGTLKVTGGFLNLSDPSIVNDSNVKEVVLSGRIGDSSTTGSGLCFMGGDTSLSFSKNIVAEGEGGVLRSYASASNVVEFTGSVTGTTIRHSDGGTHKFSGTVDLQKFVQSGATGNQTVTEFAGTTTLGMLEQTLGTTKFTGGTANVGTMAISGGALNISGGTVSATTLNITGGTTTISGGTTTTMNGTIVSNGGVLEISAGSDGWGSSALRGGLHVLNGGTARFSAKDVSGWSNDTKNRLGDITIDAGGVLEMNVNNNDTFRGTLTLNGTLKAGANGGNDTRVDLYGGSAKIVTTEAGAKIESGVKLQLRQSDSEIRVGDGASLEIASVIFSASNEGNGLLRKTEGGALILSGANTYGGGTTIEGGVLVAKNMSALGTNSVRVAGGQLKVSNVTLNQTAITVVLGETYKADGGVAALVGESSGALATGTTVTVTVDDATDLNALGLVAGVANEYSIWDPTLTTDATLALSEEFESLLAANGWEYAVSGGVLTISSIPEPSTFGLLAGLGALALAGTRRRRRKA